MRNPANSQPARPGRFTPSAAPIPGSLWAIRSGGEHVVYRLEGIDADGDYQLRLVEVVRTRRIDRTVGDDTIRVERAWFTVREDVYPAGSAS